MKKQTSILLSLFLASFMIVAALCFTLPVSVSADETELFYTDFDGTPYTGMNPESGGAVSYILEETYGADFSLEAVINIKSIVNDSGRGVKFILRDCPVASSGDLEVWIGAYDIWACTDGWKGNGTVSGFRVDPYLDTDITVRLDVKGDSVTMYIDGNLIWSWTDPSFSAGGETNLEIGGWDAKFDIKSIRVSPAPEDEPELEEEHVDPTPEMGGTIYYVDADAPAGGDGLSPETAWKSIAQVNAHEQFLPDDQILFKRGCVWEGSTLSPKGYGIEGHPIIIDSYGEGDLPIIDRQGKFVPGSINGTSTVILTNQSYWTFRNIQISNHNPEAPGTVEDVHVTESGAEFVMRHGVVIQANYVVGAAKKIVRGIVFENVVFDGIDTSHGDEGNCYYYRIENKSAGSGGGALCFRANDSSDGASRAYVDGITVDGCTFHNIGGGGISIQSGWKYFDTFSNVVIRNNFIYNDPDTPLSCSGIYVVSAVDPLVEYNTIQDMTNGIGFQLCENATAQYNTIVRMDGYLEITSRYTGTAQYWDGCGIDADCGCRGTTTFRGNYIEDCREGSFAFFDYQYTDPAVVRIEDNISYNCGTFMYYQCDNASYDFIIRNNTIVRLPGSAANAQNEIIHIYNGTLDRRSIMFSNNIFYYPSQIVILEYAGSTYSGNNYNGIAAEVEDGSAIAGDPLLNLPEDSAITTNMSYNGSVPGTSSFLNSKLFTLLQNSPCISDGEVICGAKLGVLSQGEPNVDPADPSVPETTPGETKGDSNSETPSAPVGGIIAAVIVVLVITAAVIASISVRKNNAN